MLEQETLVLVPWSPSVLEQTNRILFLLDQLCRTFLLPFLVRRRLPLPTSKLLLVLGDWVPSHSMSLATLAFLVYQILVVLARGSKEESALHRSRKHLRKLLEEFQKMPDRYVHR